MYEITLNNDETIEVDFWGQRLNIAHELRPDAWYEIIHQWIADGNTLNFDATLVQDLFVTLRIDAARARRMLNAGGDTSVAPIDPRPEAALEGESQFIEDELANEDMIFEALRERLGMDTLILGDEAHAEVFTNMRETLKAEGKLKPGLRGL